MKNWANTMNIGMKVSQGSGSIVPPIALESIALPLCHEWHINTADVCVTYCCSPLQCAKILLAQSAVTEHALLVWNIYSHFTSFIPELTYLFHRLLLSLRRRRPWLSGRLVVNKSSDLSCTKDMIHNKIAHQCPQPSIALQCRVVA